MRFQRRFYGIYTNLIKYWWNIRYDIPVDQHDAEMVLKELQDTSSYKLAKVTYMHTILHIHPKNLITGILFLNSDGHFKWPKDIKKGCAQCKHIFFNKI